MKNIFCKQILGLGLLGIVGLSLAEGASYHISVTGADSESRDGKSATTAWKTLAFACDKAQAGDTLKLSEGAFVESKTCLLKDNTTIMGVDTAKTRVLGSGSWTLTGNPRDVNNNRNNYIIAFASKKGISISHISFASQDTSHRLNGAIWTRYSEGITLANLAFTEFFWDGVCLLESKKIDLHHNRFYNSSMEKDLWWGGAILARWIKQSRFYDNEIIQDRSGGYGYKAQDAGHEDVKIFRNHIAVLGFSIESAHDDEYGFEIYDNTLTTTVSVPRTGAGDPKRRGFDYAVWIHHNRMFDSYAVEGPRSYLRISHNFIDVRKTGGNIYSQHGGNTNGPTWIHNNVILGLDRGFVWTKAGTSADFHIYNNTIYCADAEDRTGPVLGVATGAARWAFHNNIVIAPAEKPRKLYEAKWGGDTIVNASHNIFMNVSNTQPGNWSDVHPGLALAGTKPFPYYGAKSGSSYLVNKGKDVGLPFTGSAPDIGAYEFGASATTAFGLAGAGVPRRGDSPAFRFDPRLHRLTYLSAAAPESGRLPALFTPSGRHIDLSTRRSGEGFDLGGLARGTYLLLPSEGAGAAPAMPLRLP